MRRPTAPRRSRRTPRLLALAILSGALLATAPAQATPIGGGNVVPGLDVPQPTWKWKGAPGPQ